MGSPYGCLDGAVCYPDNRSKRDKPEFLGYDSAPAALTAVGVGIILMTGCTSLCCVSFCYRLKKEILVPPTSRNVRLVDVQQEPERSAGVEDSASDVSSARTAA